MIENTERSERTDSRSDIERIVMRRVRLTRILLLIISTATLATLAFIATLWGIGREVWIARIFENAPADPWRLLAFYLAAFLNTSLVVQALTLLTLASLVYLIVETARFLSSFFPPASNPRRASP